MIIESEITLKGITRDNFKDEQRQSFREQMATLLELLVEYIQILGVRDVPTARRQLLTGETELEVDFEVTVVIGADEEEEATASGDDGALDELTQQVFSDATSKLTEVVENGDLTDSLTTDPSFEEFEVEVDEGAFETPTSFSTETVVLPNPTSSPTFPPTRDDSNKVLQLLHGASATTFIVVGVVGALALGLGATVLFTRRRQKMQKYSKRDRLMKGLEVDESSVVMSGMYPIGDSGASTSRGPRNNPMVVTVDTEAGYL